jgi:hypothetical protein
MCTATGIFYKCFMISEIAKNMMLIGDMKGRRSIQEPLGFLIMLGLFVWYDRN